MPRALRLRRLRPRRLVFVRRHALAEAAVLDQPAGEPQSALFERPVRRVGPLAMLQSQPAQALDLVIAEAGEGKVRALCASHAPDCPEPCGQREGLAGTASF